MPQPIAPAARQTTPGYFSTDLIRYRTVVARALGARGFGLHPADVTAAWHSGRSVEHLVDGIVAEGVRRAPVNAWAGQSIAQIVAQVVADERAMAKHLAAWRAA